MISKRADKFTSFIVMDVMAKAEELERRGENIIHLEVGEPDFPTPENIGRSAACRAGASAPSSTRGAQPVSLSLHSHWGPGAA